MITKRQKQILDFLISYESKKGYAPSLKETKNHFKLSTESTVHQHIEALKEKGYLKKMKNQPRGIEVSKIETSIQIPILGKIAAGYPIEAIELSDETLTIPSHEINQREKHYALRVSGNSMIDDGIFDGDLVVIREQQSVDDGQTVVAIIDDNQATLKKIYREKNRFRLQPANQMLLPFYRTEVEIRGIVVKIIRDLESNQNTGGNLFKLVIKMPLTTNVKRLSNSEQGEKARPFIQWVGGKRDTIAQIADLIPKKFNNYYEPFLGGGAMFFHLQPEKAVISDNNTELIKTYEGVRDNPEEVIKLLKELRYRHSLELFMKVRNFDREVNIFEKISNSEIAARMIYLNQTCFNGLYRVNQKGQFNVPIGSSLNRLICDEHTIRSVSKILKNVTIKETDFEKTVEDAKKGDFVYFDPPYHPVSVYSDFTRYTKEKFYIEDQKRLKNKVDELNKIGCKVMLSNSDCEFIRDLYSNYNLHEVMIGRNLNSKREKRGKVSELLITNY
ncbi:MAG: transcriptional repressor LexA [Candidatus Parcubacteria bacterium]|nr:transcriptional repressor LexA [Candidatus Parcubacteria bacterium]